MGALPKKVVSEDRRLDGLATTAAADLMKLRWHWTLDESNPDRVAIREYARCVGRDPKTIGVDAKAFAAMTGEGGGALTPNAARERAKMGAETEAATEAVADARGLAFSHARKDRPVEVKRVREIARQRAEDKGTSIEEEAPKVAAMIVKAEMADARSKKSRAGARDLRLIEMEGHLTKAQRSLTDALGLARAIDWDDGQRDVLANTVAAVRALLGLIDVALVGEVEVDWDAELVKITGAAS